MPKTKELISDEVKDRKSRDVKLLLVAAAISAILGANPLALAFLGLTGFRQII